MQNQKDITLIDYKDHIKRPKPNGYQSLHLILQIPIFLSNKEELVNVEIQIRTIAMDFWASLEHKIYYKYNKEIPFHIKNELKEAAYSAAKLDRKMENIHKEVNKIKQLHVQEDMQEVSIDNKTFYLPEELMLSLMKK